MNNNDEIIQKLDVIVANYLNQKDHNGQLLTEKYSETYIYSLVQKHLFDYEAIFTASQKSVIDVFDFITSLLKFTSEPIEDTLFIIVQAIDFFKAICEEYQTYTIKFSDLSSYLCKYNPNLDEKDVPLQNRTITYHKYPPLKQFNKPQSRQVRSIDLEAPTILGTLGHYIKRINKEKIYIDSQKNQNSSILRMQYQESELKILILHQYSDFISIYNPDCTLQSRLRPKAQQLRNIIHDFYWSEEQQRIGIVFKDAWICFMDQSDQFELEKYFTTKVDQHRIYYVQNKWMTVGVDSKISIWNLETENSCVISHDQIKNVVNIIEITYLQLVCIACQDKLTMWDLWEHNKPKLLFKLQVNHSRLNNIVFFQEYHLIITSGFDTKVNLYQLHKKYNDGDYVGQLEGHTAIVTAIQCVEKSPIVITTDDRLIVKLWDIRIMKCIQSFDLEMRQSINYITIMQNLSSVCFATNRLIVMAFEGHNKNLSQPKPLKQRTLQLFPKQVELDAIKKQLIVSTNRDIRIINLSNGQTDTIIKAMIGQTDDMINQFKPIQQHKKIVLGTTKGLIKIFDTYSGDLIKEYQNNSNKITHLSIDYQNRIISTSSLDGQLHIYKENNLNFESLRKAENVHNGIDYCYVSLFHDLIITAGVDIVCLWNLEFTKPVSTIRTESAPKGVHILDGYRIIIIGCKTNTYFLQFDKSEDQYFYQQLGFIPQSCCAFTDKNGTVLLGSRRGMICKLSFTINKCQKAQFHPFRQNWEDYNIGVNNHKVTRFVVNTTHELKLDSQIEAHKKRLSHIDFISLEGDNVIKEGQSKVITTSKDGFLKIFDYPSFDLMCALNVNHVLPLKWSITIDEHEIMKFKVAFALKVIHFIRSQPNLTISHLRMLEPNSIFKNLLGQKKFFKQNTNENKVQLLQDFYEPRDLVFQKVKGFYKNELQGLSLKQIEEKKKALLQAKMFEKDYNEQNFQSEQKQNEDIGNKEFKSWQQFLHPNFRKNGVQGEIEQIERLHMVHQFEKRLDQVLTKEDDTNIKPNVSGRRYSKTKQEIQNKSANKSSRLRSTLPFFQYASDRKLASIPASTDTSQRSTHVGYDTMREEYSKKRIQRVQFLSQNIGQLISDLDQNKKKQGLEIGENTMRKTSGQVFNQIVNKLNEKLRDSKFKKYSRSMCKQDLEGILIDAHLDSMHSKQSLRKLP
ncbi:unnamed protein product [Paramecium octaurelia]|uniref:Uncharacterized protein n=1 Tax=Paramecium octaurelia TaxID=43137 RepID=A0A8S1WDK9_PAROT|nr:unnamed protein product [Paramecium octaurelia]